MKPFTLEGNVKYLSSLRQKSSSKSTEVIEMILSKGSTDIKFAKKGVDQR